MRRVVWRIPSDKEKLTDDFLSEDLTKPALEDLYSNSLIPFVKNAADAKEELIILLKIAAEVEHALMIQYLYAAYSIVDDSDSIKKSLLKISKQEMGHYLAVQNLLLSIGGIEAVHLHKSEFRPVSVKNNPLPYTLEPLSKKLLAKFVAVEAPLEVPEQFKEEVEEIRKIADEKAGVKLNPVGGLFMKIFWLFQPDDNPVEDLIPLTPNEELGRKPGWHVKDTDFLPVSEIKKFEALETLWGSQSSFQANQLTLSQIHDCRDALGLVYEIAAQGEGANFDDQIDSHFELFLRSYRKFGDSNIDITNIPLNPITVENKEFKTSTLIENQYSLLWISLLNSVYTSLLLDIYSSFFYTQFKQANKNSFIGLIFSCMKSSIKPLSLIVAKLPLLNNGFQYDTDPRCGPTFEIGEDFLLSPSKAVMDELNISYIKKIRELIASIRKHSDFKSHLDAEEEQDSDSEVNAEGSLSQVENYCSEKEQLILD